MSTEYRVGSERAPVGAFLLLQELPGGLEEADELALEQRIAGCAGVITLTGHRASGTQHEWRQVELVGCSEMLVVRLRHEGPQVSCHARSGLLSPRWNAAAASRNSTSSGRAIRSPLAPKVWAHLPGRWFGRSTPNPRHSRRNRNPDIGRRLDGPEPASGRSLHGDHCPHDRTR